MKKKYTIVRFTRDVEGAIQYFLDSGGQGIVELRESFRTSQTCFASMLGITREYLCYMERDKRKISRAIANQLAFIYLMAHKVEVDPHPQAGKVSPP